MPHKKLDDLASNFIGLLIGAEIVLWFIRKKNLEEKIFFGYPVINWIYLLIASFSLVFIQEFVK